MKKWMALGQAFENIGMALLVDCENMDVTCEVDEAFEGLYSSYAMMLETLKAQRRFINARFDEIDNAFPT